MSSIFGLEKISQMQKRCHCMDPWRWTDRGKKTKGFCQNEILEGGSFISLYQNKFSLDFLFNIANTFKVLINENISSLHFMFKIRSITKADVIRYYIPNMFGFPPSEGFFFPPTAACHLPWFNIFEWWKINTWKKCKKEKYRTRVWC